MSRFEISGEEFLLPILLGLQVLVDQRLPLMAKVCVQTRQALLSNLRGTLQLQLMQLVQRRLLMLLLFQESNHLTVTQMEHGLCIQNQRRRLRRNRPHMSSCLAFRCCIHTCLIGFSLILLKQTKFLKLCRIVVCFRVLRPLMPVSGERAALYVKD